MCVHARARVVFAWAVREGGLPSSQCVCEQLLLLGILLFYHLFLRDRIGGSGICISGCVVIDNRGGGGRRIVDGGCDCVRGGGGGGSGGGGR